MNICVKDENGYIYHLIEKIGSGGQGCVFKVRDNDAIVIKALCHPDSEDIIVDEKKYDDYRNKIQTVMSVGEFSYLAIPYVMLEKPLCGYVMLFMTGLEPISHFMLPYIYKNKNGKLILNSDLDTKKGRFLASTTSESFFSYNHNGGLSKRLRCLARLANILAVFSDMNVVYCDISPNNVYISKDKLSYEVWLIDLDNLCFSSSTKHAIGTPKYMAPEIVKGEANTIFSDEYSFALVAYQFLTFADPFIGKMIDEFGSWDAGDYDDEAFDKAISRGEIPWIWEKEDPRNRSESGLNPHLLLNNQLLELFERTFNQSGRNNPTKRPSMWEWYDSLIIAYESLIPGELKYSDEVFDEIIKKGRSYYYQKINYLNNVNPFNNEKGPKKYNLTISRIVHLVDEIGNTEMIAIPDKTIHWSASNDINSYYFSNYDLLLKNPQVYIIPYVSLIRQEQLFSTSSDFRIVKSYDDIEFLAFEDGRYISKTVKNITQTIFYVKYKGEFIKKITIEMEK